RNGFTVAHQQALRRIFDAIDVRAEVARATRDEYAGYVAASRNEIDTALSEVGAGRLLRLTRTRYRLSDATLDAAARELGEDASADDILQFVEALGDLPERVASLLRFEDVDPEAEELANDAADQ